MEALDAAQVAGGDARGMQSGALLVVAPRVRDGFSDRVVDIRVDDHRQSLAVGARDTSPENDNAWVALADVQLRMGRRGEALASLREAVKVNPGRRNTLPRDTNFRTLFEDPEFRRIIG